jgi:hypothetical protein
VAETRLAGYAVWDCAIGGGGNNCGSTNVNEGFTVVGTNTAGNPTIVEQPVVCHCSPARSAG